MKIKSITAREILASIGYPTIEVKVTLESGTTAIASVPYGASAGTYEATVLLDEDKSRYQGNGMLKAIKNVNEIIAPEILKISAEDQRSIDNKMISLDGTTNKGKLGGNAILAISLAIGKAAAAEKNIPFYRHIIEIYNIENDLSKLPGPMVVVIEGGKHADNSTDLQEFCITGIGNDGPAEKIRRALESYHALRGILKENKLSINVGNEGAFAPNGIKTNEAPFQFIIEAIKKAGYTPGKDLALSIDAAASEFFKDGKYELAIEDRRLNANELIAYYQTWLEKYPIVSIEDMLHEDDWENWQKLNKITKEKNVRHIGDDLTVTNIQRLQKAIDLNAIDSILIKLNQIGSLSETIDCCLLAKKNGLMTVTSHRGGGETNDTSMVDVAVAVGSSFIKVGPTRGERVSKYNRLMEIEAELRKN